MSGRSWSGDITSLVARALGAACLTLAAAGLAPACSPATPADTPAGATAAPSATAAPVATTKVSAAPTASASAAAPSLPPVTLEPVERTKIDGKPPVLGIVAPAKSAVLPAAKAPAFEVRLSAKGWTPAAGDHLCVVLDKRPCRRVDDPAKAIPLGELGPLEEGQHVLSVLARRATGEVFRAGKNTPFASTSFFVGKKVPPVYKEGSPMLIYSAPEKGPAPAGGVIIDFFLANAEVKSGSFVIAATVGGPGIESGVGVLIETDRPLRIRNARPGEYLSRLTLMEFVPDLGESRSLTTVTYTSKPVAGPFGEVQRSIFVTK
jgi:hypothetical protein